MVILIDWWAGVSTGLNQHCKCMLADPVQELERTLEEDGNISSLTTIAYHWNQV